MNKTLKPEETLFSEGDPALSLYLIREGTISIRKRKVGGHVELARVYANEIIGEMSFFDRKSRSASAVALTPVEIVEIDFESLDKIYSQIPDYMKTIMASLAERLRRADDLIRRLRKEGATEDTGDSDLSGDAEALVAAASPEAAPTDGTDPASEPKS